MAGNGKVCGQCGAEGGTIGALDRNGVWRTFDFMIGLNSTEGAMLFDDGMPLEREAIVFVNAAGYELCSACNLRYYAPGMLRPRAPLEAPYVRKIERRLKRGQVPLPGDRWLE